jgi:hypothetical protein
MIAQCEIIIDKYIFRHAQAIEIDSSRTSLGDTATITLPHKYYVTDEKDEYLANILKPGMEVLIKLGYKPDLQLEFTGFVASVSPDSPVKIQCEDAMYKLKRSRPSPKSWPSTTLKDVITYLVPGAKIEVPAINLTNFKVDGKGSVAYALNKIKQAYGLDIYFRNGKLFAGLAYSDPDAIAAGTVYYNMEKNVIESRLNYRSIADVRFKIKAISVLPNNTRIEATAGDEDGALQTFHFYNITTTGELQILANESLGKLQYDGYEGDLLTFGQPMAAHGQVAHLTDNRYGTRTGQNFIDRVVTTFGENGFRRQVHLGRRAA